MSTYTIQPHNGYALAQALTEMLDGTQPYSTEDARYLVKDLAAVFGLKTEVVNPERNTRRYHPVSSEDATEFIQQLKRPCIIEYTTEAHESDDPAHQSSQPSHSPTVADSPKRSAATGQYQADSA